VWREPPHLWRVWPRLCSSALLSFPGVSRILVVDDDADICEVFSNVLRAAGHEVRLASDGAEALRVFESWRPQLVLLDLFMPNVDGLEALRAIRETSGAVKIIAMSGGWAGPRRSSPVDVLEQALALGANAVLAKPIDGVVLRRTVDAVLGAMPKSP
jgi:CheY-like chemotaxis protein